MDEFIKNTRIKYSVDDLKIIFENLKEFENKETCTKICNAMLILVPEIIFSICRRGLLDLILKDILLNINTTITDDHKRTFLFHSKNIDNLLLVLKSNASFDINYCDINGVTFVAYYSVGDTFMDKERFNNFIDLLQKRNYNFNINEKNNRGFFRFSMKETIINHDLLSATLKIPTLDITMNLLWLKLLLNNSINSYSAYTNFRIIIQSIDERNDFISIPNKIIDRLHYHKIFDESDVVKFLKMVHDAFEFLSKANEGYIKEIIEFKNDNNDTIIHLAAKYHYKEIMNYLLNVIRDLNIKVEPNNQKKYPIDLYLESKIFDRLKTLQIK